MKSARSRNRLVLAGIAALFFGPLLLAVFMQSRWWGYEPADTVNAGRLVEPPVPLDLRQARLLHSAGAEPFAGAWVLLYAFRPPCGPACSEAAVGLRQVHRASGRHRDRLLPVVLARGEMDSAAQRRLVRIYPQLVLLDDPRDALQAPLRRALANAGLGPSPAAGRALVIDPPGNIILAYAPGFAPADLKQDLDRLLSWSAQDTAP